MFVRYDSAERRGHWVERGVYHAYMASWWAANVGMPRLDTREDWDGWLAYWKRSELPLLATFLHSEFLDGFRHPANDELWRQSDLTSELTELDVPLYYENGWYNGSAGRYLRNFKTISAKARSEAARKAQKLIIGPWSHGGGTPETDTVRFGPRPP
jgi:predicted acyl esterase